MANRADLPIGKVCRPILPLIAEVDLNRGETLHALMAGLLLMTMTLLPLSARARETGICDRAAQTAAAQTGVPETILRAIARVEAGRQMGGSFSPWPWTVNQGGAGRFFDSRPMAEDHVRQAIASGETNIDIGCFQINYRWHGAAFPTVDAMFDPAINARYAASFLVRLKEETGSWDKAIGAYHSRRDAAADDYLAKVAQQVSGPDDPRPVPDLGPRTAVLLVNGYPLLQGGRGKLGSLVASDARGTSAPLLR